MTEYEDFNGKTCFVHNDDVGGTCTKAVVVSNGEDYFLVKGGEIIGDYTPEEISDFLYGTVFGQTCNQGFGPWHKKCLNHNNLFTHR